MQIFTKLNLKYSYSKKYIYILADCCFAIKALYEKFSKSFVDKNIYFFFIGNKMFSQATYMSLCVIKSPESEKMHDSITSFYLGRTCPQPPPFSSSQSLGAI